MRDVISLLPRNAASTRDRLFAATGRNTVTPQNRVIDLTKVQGDGHEREQGILNYHPEGTHD
jgi:hypothetical protein